MNPRDQARLLLAFHAYRFAGYACPEAWRFANEFVSDRKLVKEIPCSLT